MRELDYHALINSSKRSIKVPTRLEDVNVE